MPDWALEIPSAPVHQEQPNQLVRPFTAQQLIEFGQELIEQFLRRVVLAVAGSFIPGEASFDQLRDWALNLPVIGDILTKINEVFSAIFGGIDFTGELPTPEEVWSTVVSTFINPLINVVEAVAEALLTAPLNAANLFGRIALGQFGSGVPIMALTTAVPNELETFTAASVPTSDGWSFNSGQDAAQVVADGSTKGLWLKSGVIKVEEGQPVNTTVKVKYSGISSGAGQTIRYVLETYESEDGSGPMVPVVVGSITNPSGTVSSPVTLGDTSWDIPVGVQSVRPLLEVDEAVTAGTVFWLNTPELFKKLAGPLSEGLPAAIQARIDEFQGLLSDLLTNPAAVISSIPQALVAGLTGAVSELNQIRDILRGLVVTPINSAIQDIKDWWTALGGKVQNLTSGGTLPPTSVDSAAGGTSLGQDLLDTWNKIVGGYRRTAATGQTSADVEEVMMSVGQEILVAQESTITLANQANAPRNVPFWVSPNRFEEVSFPRALLQPVPSIGSGGSGTTGTGSGLSGIDANWNAEERDAVQGHTHSTPSHSHALSYVKPTFTIPDGTLALTAITMTQDRLINVARFLAGGGTPPSTALYVGIYAIDPATGTATLIYDYGDQKGNINTGADLYETALNLPADMLTDAGAMFAVGILPVGGSFAVAGVRRQPIVTAAVIYPVAATELVSGQSSLPATVDSSSMNHTSTHRIWVSLGQAVESIPEDTSPVTLTMTFNVADTSAWSSPSFQQYGNASSNFTVDNGQIYGGGPTVFIGDVTYWRSALCLTPLHTNDHMAEITLGTGWDNDAYGYATDRAYVRCNSSGTSGVCLHVDATGGAVRVRIATVTNLTSIGTVRVTATGIPYAVGDRFSIRAVGNVYTAYRNDSPILDGNGDPVAWTDSGNTVPVGKAWRRTAFGSGSRATNGFSHYEPAHIDAFKAADLAA